MERFSEAIETAKIDVVPKVMINGGGASTQGNVFEALLALVLSDKLAGHATELAPRDARATAIRDGLIASIGPNGKS